MAGKEKKDGQLKEENGMIVKRTTIVDLYKKMEVIEENQHDLCQKFDEHNERLAEYNNVKERLDEHLEFCEDYRAEKDYDVQARRTYQQGYADAEENAKERAERQMKDSMYFWVKIIIPVSAVVFGLIYWLSDRFIL